ncbi:MAG: hypothetical protein WD689_09695 [Gaiellaceae bacterium]
MTLIGVAVAGGLIWFATWIDPTDSIGEYWAAMGLVAGGGLVLALSQLLGGWTKWGVPSVSSNVFALGFLPAAIVGGWILVAAQPSGSRGRGRVLDWSGEIGIGGIVGDLTTLVGAIALGLGLVFGLVFDTTGPRRRDEHGEYDRRVADEPTAAERARAAAAEPPLVDAGREPEPVGADVGTATLPEPEPAPKSRRRIFGR